MKNCLWFWCSLYSSLASAESDSVFWGFDLRDFPSEACEQSFFGIYDFMERTVAARGFLMDYPVGGCATGGDSGPYLRLKMVFTGPASERERFVRTMTDVVYQDLNITIPFVLEPVVQARFTYSFERIKKKNPNDEVFVNNFMSLSFLGLREEYGFMRKALRSRDTFLSLVLKNAPTHFSTIKVLFPQEDQGYQFTLVGRVELTLASGGQVVYRNQFYPISL